MLSPSEIFTTAMTGKRIQLGSYLWVEKSVYDGRLKVKFAFDQGKDTQVIRQISVNNPLAMIQAMQTLTDELAVLVSNREKVRQEQRVIREQEKAQRQQARQESAQQELARNFLNQARSIVESINEKKRAQETQELVRRHRMMDNVRRPIMDILARVAPVIDPYAYRNVYGKPAEVHFH